MRKCLDCYSKHQKIVERIKLLDKDVNDLITTLNTYGKYTTVDICINGTLYTNELNEKMNKMYDLFFYYICGKSVNEICDHVHNRLLNKDICLVGGFGHHVYSYKLKFHPHWCVKPGFYDQAILSIYEEIACQINDINISICKSPAQETWGN